MWVLIIVRIVVLLLLLGVFSVSVVSEDIVIIGMFSVSVMFCVSDMFSCMLVKVFGLWFMVIVLSVWWLMLVLVSSVLVIGSISLVWWCGVSLLCVIILLLCMRVMEYDLVVVLIVSRFMCVFLYWWNRYDSVVVWWCLGGVLWVL